MFIQKMFDNWKNKTLFYFYYHSDNGQSINSFQKIPILKTKCENKIFISKYYNGKISALRKEFIDSLKNRIESYHYSILWEKNILFYNNFYDTWSQTAKDYHIKNGYLYCRLKDTGGRWIENKIILSPFTKYCNLDGLIKED